MLARTVLSLQWRHNKPDGVSTHQPPECLPNGLFRRRSKKISKIRVTGLWAGNSPVTGEFPAQMVSDAENVPIWWRHHDEQKPTNLALEYIRCLSHVLQLTRLHIYMRQITMHITHLLRNTISTRERLSDGTLHFAVSAKSFVVSLFFRV